MQHTSHQIKGNVLVVLTPPESALGENFIELTGHPMREIAISIQEQHPLANVELINLAEYGNEWKEKLQDKIELQDINFLVLNPEASPALRASWDWDLFFLSSSQGYFLHTFFILFDSVYIEHLHRLNRLLKINPNSTVISIDRNVNKFLMTKVSNFGPIFLPVSQKSIKSLQKNLQCYLYREKLIFIGTVFKNRRKFLTKLEKRHSKFEVNPNRPANQPSSYIDYFRELSKAGAVVNLSRSNGTGIKHSKSRLLEANLVGCIALSDNYRKDRRLLPKRYAVLPLSVHKYHKYLFKRVRAENREAISDYARNIASREMPIIISNIIFQLSTKADDSTI